VNGQWYVIALRRTWSSNTTALVAIAGATTSTSTPTAPPSTLPTLNSDPGVLTDQPISWAWCNSANTTVVVYDMRQFPVRRMPLTVANNVVRDGIFQTPTQGQQVWRNDLGEVETYYGAYNAISNPGGRDTAGWYTTDRAGGLVPIRPTTVTAVSGSASVNSLGVITVSSVNGVLIDGVFTSRYRNYVIECEIGGGTHLGLQLRTGGTNNGTANYSLSGYYTQGTGLFVSNQQYLTSLQVGWANLGHVSLKISSPAHDKATNIISQEDGYDGSSDRPHHTGLAGYFGATTLFDGLRLFGLSTVFSGNIAIYGMVE
jgi:hypothetical protein